jgi:hypothetical protein
MLVEI